MMNAQEIQSKIILPRDLPPGAILGPLIFRGIESSNGWISVAWEPKTPAYARRYDGKIPGENDLLLLSIQLHGIEPRYRSYSNEPAKREKSRLIFNQGVQKLLENGRIFYFQAMHEYAGPGQTGGLLVLDYEGGTTLQTEMVRCGYAVVSQRTEAQASYPFDDGVRDRLLRLEGEAKAYKLGAWSEP